MKESWLPILLLGNQGESSEHRPGQRSLRRSKSAGQSPLTPGRKAGYLLTYKRRTSNMKALRVAKGQPTPPSLTRHKLTSRQKDTLAGVFKYFLCFMFTPIPGEMIQFDEHIFQMGWNHQLAQKVKKSPGFWEHSSLHLPKTCPRFFLVCFFFLRKRFEKSHRPTESPPFFWKESKNCAISFLLGDKSSDPKARLDFLVSISDFVVLELLMLPRSFSRWDRRWEDHGGREGKTGYSDWWLMLRETCTFMFV